METLKLFYKEHVKSFVAAIVGALITLMMNWVNGETPWPQTGEEWRNAAIGAVIAAVAVWFPANKITQKQLDNDKNVIGGVVVPDSSVPNAASSELPYPEPY